MRSKLFSVTLDDCDVQTFRAGGKGGQHQNKTETGVRVKHRASGAVGESRDHRSQYMNKREAFIRSPEFKRWHRLEVARRMGRLAEIEREVDQAMQPGNLRIEVQREGRWVPYDDASV